MKPISVGAKLSRNLPKEAIFRNLEIAPKVKAAISSDVRKLTLIHTISPQTSTLAAGENVQEINVIEIELKKSGVDLKVLEVIAKALPFKVLFVLTYEGQERFAAYHSKLFVTEWGAAGEYPLKLTGLNLDAIWKNIVAQVGGFEVGVTEELDVAIARKEKTDKLQKQLARLEKQAWGEKQPKRKYELVQRIRTLIKILEGNTDEN